MLQAPILLWVKFLSLNNLNICFMGDFNAIVGDHEQIGQRNIHRISCDEFRQFISDSGLIDVETTGSFLTWRSSHAGPIATLRLDRFPMSHLFSELWASFSALVLPKTTSDHSLLLLKCRTSVDKKFKPFRFQSFWVNHPDFRTIIYDSWTLFVAAKDPISVCVRKLKRLKGRLKVWSKDTFGNLFLVLEEQQRELSMLQQQYLDNPLGADLTDREREIISEINNTLRNQHELLRQKSRVKWLTDGDRNTGFFHRMNIISRGKSPLSAMMIDGLFAKIMQ